jgi:hypothetical protein
VADAGNARVVMIPNENGTLNSADQITIGSGLISPVHIGAMKRGDVVIIDSGLNQLVMINRSQADFVFTAQTVGTTSPAQGVSLWSIGNQQLTFSNPLYTSMGDASSFEIQSAATDGCDLTGATPLATGFSCGLSLVSQPATTGAFAATFTLTSNAVNLTPVTLQSNGTGQASQTITFPNPGTQTYGVTPITLSATASSGLPVSYAVTAGPATVNGSTLTITGTGSITVQATQAGNANYSAATPVSDSFTVNQAPTNYMLTVSTSGSGTVTSTDGYINCGSSCTHSYASSTSVTLNASPASGWSFTSWGGACSGAGSCVVSMQATQTVNATFTQNTTSFPAPVITSLSPAITKAGSAGFTLTVNGSGFVTGAGVRWNGSDRTSSTTWVSAVQLSVPISATDIASEETVDITVSNPAASGGGTSAKFEFVIDTPNGASGAFTVSSPTTLNVSQGQSAPLQISFTGTAAGAQISATCVNLPAGASCSYAGGIVTITTLASLPRGTYPIIVIFTVTQQTSASMIHRGILVAAWAGFAGLPLGLLWIGGGRKKDVRRNLLVLSGLLLILLLASCGGSSSTPATSTPTPTLTTTQSSMPITLTVN